MYGGTVANPAHAPYGRAAVAALQREHLYEAARSKFVLGENVSQAAQFVESGNADAGIIALSLARSPALRESGAYYEIPTSWYPPIEQAAVVLKASRHKETARRFLDFLKQPETGRVMRDFGFSIPQPGGHRK